MPLIEVPNETAVHPVVVYRHAVRYTKTGEAQPRAD